MREDQEIQEYDDIFTTLHLKLHHTAPTEEDMIRSHHILADLFNLLSKGDANISGIQNSSDWAMRVAKIFLRTLDRRTDKAWSFNEYWRHAARTAERIFAETKDTKDPEKTKNSLNIFHIAMKNARNIEKVYK